MCADASAACPRRYYAQIRELAARGVKEIVLLGQTVNAYRYDGSVSADCCGWSPRLTASSASASLRRIRATCPSGDRRDGGRAKVQPYLHLPMQSGSDRVLAAMDRGYTSRNISTWSRAARGDSRTRALDRHHRGLSRRGGNGLSRDARSDARGRLRLGLHLQVLSARTHAGLRLGDTVSEAEKRRRLTE